MKKTISIVAFSSALIASGGVSFLTSCGIHKHELTPQVRQIRKMNENVANINIGNDFRVQILDDTTVRFEHKYQNPIYGTFDFLDDDTLFVPNRTLYPGPTSYKVIHAPTSTIIKLGKITITVPDNIGFDMKGITVDHEEQGRLFDSTTQQINDNTGELPNPEDTGYVYQFVDYPRIIEPILGYSESNQYIEPYRSHWNKGLKENCGFEIQDHKDIYLTFPENDAKALRKQYRNLAGAPEMVRLSTLGAWDSRYYPYNEQTAQEEVDHYYENNLPLDNLIIDTDWRAGFDGKGYFVNETLFPNMPRFLKSIHNQNIEVAFNDHPEPQKDENDQELPVLDPKEVEFRRFNLDKIMDMGLDTWWYDRNWSTSLICPGGKTEEHEKMLNHETWGDYLYNCVAKQQHIDHIDPKYADYGQYAYKRPTTMSNVVQIRNGNWEGFTDSAAHRYSIQWTGDQNPKMLPTEVQNVVRTGVRSMPYMSSDLAGHNVSVASDYYYQRWMEYGALSPIFRIHCTRDLEQHCQPWYRPEEVLNTFRNWINLRYRLLPLYYSLAKEAYDTGVPICRALAFEYPEEIATHGMENEYLIGSNILFAPCLLNDRNMKLDGTWQGGHVNAEFFNGKEPGDPGTGVKTIPLDNIDISKEELKQLAEKVFGPGKTTLFSIRFTGSFTPSLDQDMELVMNFDDGVKVKVTDPDGITTHSAQDWEDGSTRDLKTGITLQDGLEYGINIEYKQNTEDGEIHMFGDPINPFPGETKKVYLPKGEWLDVFSGTVYNNTEGGSEKDIFYEPGQNALFIKLGTMLPLINNAQNTKELDWTNLVYDVYPSKTAQPYSSSLYEDDFETMGYQDGHYHNSQYSCGYENGKFIINLAPSIGSFIGDEAIANRTYTLRLHKVDGIDFSRLVKVDGVVVEGTLIPANSSVEMPFNFSGASKTEDIIEIRIPISSIRAEHRIEIALLGE